MVWVKRVVIHHIPKFEGLIITTSKVVAIFVKMAFFEILKMSRIFECLQKQLFTDFTVLQNSCS